MKRKDKGRVRPPIPLKAVSVFAEDPFRRSTQFEEGTGPYKRYFGVYRGFVEFNRDPEQRGRIKVRVPEFDGPEFRLDEDHTEEPYVATLELQWVEPCMSMGAGKGFGSFTVPQVGATVFVMYVGGKKDNPIYFGGWPGIPAGQARYGSTKTTTSPPYGEDSEGEAVALYDPAPPPYWTEDGWMEEQGNDAPREVTEQISNQPDIHMLWKSMKGASFLINERDTWETIVLTDRLGAELRMEYPTTTAVNDEMALRRNLHSATQHNQMDVTNLFGPYGRLLLVDPVRQGVEIHTSPYEYDRLDISLHDHTSDNQKVKDTQADTIRLSMNSAETLLRIDYVEDFDVVARIELDLLQRAITIKGLDRLKFSTTDLIDIEADRIRLRGDVEIDGELDIRNNDIRFIGGTAATTGTNIRNWKKEHQTMHDDESDLEPIWEE
jgi:hypothetical protein